jgi:hypothetical protein
MNNHIIFFSGGLASFAVAHLVKERNPNDNIVLLFTDTLFEDADLYRFINEASDKLKLPLLILTDGRTPLELMEKRKFLFNSRIADCSIVLKVKPAKDLIIKGIYTDKYEWRNKQYLVNENFLGNPILYFGISYDEIHRQASIVRNWQPYKTEMPLIDTVVDKKELLELYNIEIPRLYKMGFTHNNCKGRCIKGGQGHWLQLLKEDYVSFCEMRDFELAMNNIINAKNGTMGIKYSYMKKQGQAYTLQDLENDNKNRPEQLDMFDFGVCGCFIDELEKELEELK